MKRSFQILIFAVSTTLLIQGCTYKDNPSPVEQTTVRTLSSLTKSVAERSTPVFKEKPKVITRDVLNDILSKGLGETSIKDTRRYSLKTISEEDTPIIHSVNFNDGGWALVAGRELPNNQIIAYGEEGAFDPDNIESPEVRFWFRMTKASLKQTFEMADREAESQIGMASAQEEEENLLDSFSYDDPYVWARLYLGSTHSTTITNLGHLTETEWGQGYPWNYKCPSINGEKCPLGCVNVAVAQLLYYLHYHIGIPSGCFHTVDTSYTWNSAGYYTLNLTRSDYNAPSTRWDAMAKFYPGGVSNSYKYVGNLLIDVADRLSTHFSSTGSSAYFSHIPGALSYYNILCSTPQQYDFSQTHTQLNNSMPVLARGDDLYSGESHVWLIDGYQRHYGVTDYEYKWVTMPPDSLQYYNNINYDYVFTEEQMQQFYPDIEENQIVHEYSASDTYLLRMNWGWDGIYNSGLYSILPSGWSVDAFQFSLNTSIITGFTN
jgi:hypothetical protein